MSDIELINKLSKKELSEDEVYTFSVRLCDNEVDRDGERFDDDTLDQLATLFVGKTGIFDHDWSAKNQTARIYKTEVVTEPDVTTSAGFISRWLKGSAYMLRDGNSALISEIEAGIKREVSVGCSVSERRCSVCGSEAQGCAHERGKTYGGAVCHTVLSGATDAYEWSFVAVPAQKASGVTKQKVKKQKEEKNLTLNELMETAGSDALSEFKHLEADAAFGREAADTLRGEASRLCVAALGLDSELAKSLTAKLQPSELKGFADALMRLAPPAKPQFSTSRSAADGYNSIWRGGCDKLITLRIFKMLNDPSYIECSDVLTLHLALTDGNPCDSFEVTLPLTTPLYTAARESKKVSILRNNELVFTGVIDEVEASHDADGAVLTLCGRGLAALLMEKECQGAEFESAAFSDIKRLYIDPCGPITVNAHPMLPVRYFNVTAGTSCWRALLDFCGWAAGFTPRFAADGTLLIQPDGSNDKTVDIDGTSAVTSTRIFERRSGIASTATVTERVSGKTQPLKNKTLLGAGLSGKLSLTAPYGRLSDYAKRGEHALRESGRDWKTALVTIAEPFAAFPDDFINLSVGTLPSGSYLVREAETTIDKRGAFTVLTLKTKV